MNAIYLRRRRKVHLKAGTSSLPDNYVATLQKNLESLGFICSEALVERVRTLSIEEVGRFYRSLVEYLQPLSGAHRVFKPMYPNFPDEVMETSAAQLYWNAIAHYFTQQLPTIVPRLRAALAEPVKMTAIGLGTREEVEAIFTQLVAARTSLSPQDKEDVQWFVAQYRDRIAELLPAAVPHKENLAIVGAALLQRTSLAESFLNEHLKTATDVLRVAVAMSDGDVSLAEPTKFKTFRRRERKLLLSCLERCGDPTEDMLRWAERWKRLGERLHPGDYADVFPKTYAAFRVLRDGVPFETFNGRIERALLKREVEDVVTLLSQRPGDFARRLDHVLRVGNVSAVLTAFAQVAERVSTPVLLQCLSHFLHRNEPQALRTFFPKGEVAKVQAIENRLPPLSVEASGAAITICRATLLQRFSALPSLGKCYLDPALAKFVVPFSQRSASKSLRTLVRGSRLAMPDANTLRFFLWWKNGSSRTDIDLSAVLYDADFKYIDTVSYYNLKNFGGCHSGDIVDAPNGACEFIDLDIKRCVAKRVRYIVASLSSFTEQPYCDLPECFAGWMGRQQPGSGEIFDARTVQDKIDLAANTRLCIPMVFDLTSREVLWTDIALKKYPLWANNVANNLGGVSLMLRALTSLVKPDLHTLFSLHIEARGQLVATQDEAVSCFAVDCGLTPFDVERITSEFL